MASERRKCPHRLEGGTANGRPAGPGTPRSPFRASAHPFPGQGYSTSALWTQRSSRPLPPAARTYLSRGRAGAAQSHRPRPRRPLAAQAARPRCRRAPRSSSRRSPDAPLYLRVSLPQNGAEEGSEAPPPHPLSAPPALAPAVLHPARERHRPPTPAPSVSRPADSPTGGLPTGMQPPGRNRTPPRGGKAKGQRRIGLLEALRGGLRLGGTPRGPPERSRLGGGGRNSGRREGVGREVGGQSRGITGRAAGVAIGGYGRTRSPATCGCGAASGGGI